MLNEATKRNLQRKSSYIDEVRFHGDVPLFSWIDLNLTELCNRLCVFCPRIDPDLYPNQNLHMSLELVHRLAAELGELSYQGGIVLCGFGEPMLHPRLLEVVEAFGPDIRVELVTNGDKLTAEMAKKLRSAGLDYFVVSMYDGPEQREHFDQVFTEASISPEYYILRDRWHSEEDDFGLKLTNRGGTINVGNQDSIAPTHPCYYPAYSMTLDWNGDALLCVQDWNKRIKAGNTFQQSLMEIWTSPTLMKYRDRLFRGKRTMAPCKNCNADGTLHGFNHRDVWRDVWAGDSRRNAG
jgi:radical SAM protein with 4Fe4S-binding SPASM domain